MHQGPRILVYLSVNNGLNNISYWALRHVSSFTRAWHACQIDMLLDLLEWAEDDDFIFTFDATPNILGGFHEHKAHRGNWWLNLFSPLKHYPNRPYT